MKYALDSSAFLSLKKVGTATGGEGRGEGETAWFSFIEQRVICIMRGLSTDSHGAANGYEDADRFVRKNVIFVARLVLHYRCPNTFFMRRSRHLSSFTPPWHIPRRRLLKQMQKRMDVKIFQVNRVITIRAYEKPIKTTLWNFILISHREL